MPTLPKSTLEELVKNTPEDFKMKASQVYNWAKNHSQRIAGAPLKDEEWFFSGMADTLNSVPDATITKGDLQRMVGNRYDAMGDYSVGKQYSEYTLKDFDLSNYEERVRTFKHAADIGNREVSAHVFNDNPIDNYLSHRRRTIDWIGEDQGRIVFELQSDLHQRGRIKGYTEKGAYEKAEQYNTEYINQTNKGSRIRKRNERLQGHKVELVPTGERLGKLNENEQELFAYLEDQQNRLEGQIIDVENYKQSLDTKYNNATNQAASLRNLKRNYYNNSIRPSAELIAEMHPSDYNLQPLNDSRYFNTQFAMEELRNMKLPGSDHIFGMITDEEELWTSKEIAEALPMLREKYPQVDAFFNQAERVIDTVTTPTNKGPYYTLRSLINQGADNLEVIDYILANKETFSNFNPNFDESIYNSAKQMVHHSPERQRMFLRNILDDTSAMLKAETEAEDAFYKVLDHNAEGSLGSYPDLSPFKANITEKDLELEVFQAGQSNLNFVAIPLCINRCRRACLLISPLTTRRAIPRSHFPMSACWSNCQRLR